MALVLATGAILLLARRLAGRVVLPIGCAIAVILGIANIVTRWSDSYLATVYGVVMIAVPLALAVFALLEPTARWLRTRPVPQAR
ncbi:hypothetical protein [Nocardia puris]|uniref:Uncharacterized protein n=1 Tax=Nocardia puris TaxID=208602 RepID=A0A366DNX8_9NOCA|nr:hypothetical protein [Nocardia puris]RBO91800.1 hypothetical protein DFR74_104509 [Nocardia puris]